MSDFDDRLAALDPAAGQPYQHRDLDALISRVTAQPRRAPRRLWRNLELKIAGTLIAGSLVVAGTLAIVEEGAPGLPALALQSPNAKFAAAAPKSATMELYAEFDFSAGSSLSTSAPSAPSYQLTIPRDGAQEAAHLAGVFGVVGSPVNTNGNGTDWTVKSSSGAALDYENSGVPQWYFSSTSPEVAPATVSSTPVNPLPSKAVVASDVQHYLAEIGFNYTVASPSFGTSTTSTTGSNGTTRVTSSTEDVTYNVVVDGVTTDQTVNFSVGAHNVVAYASGPAFDVGTSYGYPLESPSAGVAALNAAQKSKISGSSAQATSSGPPIVDVTLTNNTLSLKTYELTNGTWWLLPVYNYQGAYVANGTSSTGTWSEVAIEPSYVQVSATTTNSLSP